MSDLAVGRVSALWRYPVKSMAPEPLERVDISWNGLAGDRRWAFVQDDLVRSGFPWLTIREVPAMRHYLPSFDTAERPDASLTRVRTPAGDEYDVTDPVLGAEVAAALGASVRVIKQDRGVFDTMPLSLITTRTISDLAALVGTKLEPGRFRPNLLVEATGDVPFPEDEWIGAVLRIGAFRMRVDRRDKRCVMVNIDPASHERDATILRAITRERHACLGVYGSTVEPGAVAVGDPVLIET